MNCKMHLMHFRVYFVAYSVYSPPVGRYSSVKKLCVRHSPLTPALACTAHAIRLAASAGRVNWMTSEQQIMRSIGWPPWPCM